MRQKTSEKKSSIDQIILKKQQAESIRTIYDQKNLKDLSLRLNQLQLELSYPRDSTESQQPIGPIKATQEYYTKIAPTQENSNTKKIIITDTLDPFSVRTSQPTLQNQNSLLSFDKKDLESKMTRTFINVQSLNPKFKSFEKITEIGMVTTKDSKAKLPRIRRDYQTSIHEQINDSNQSIQHNKALSIYPNSTEDLQSKSVAQSPFMTNRDKLFKKIMKDTTVQLQWSPHKSAIRKPSTIGIESQRCLPHRLDAGSPLLGSTISDSCRLFEIQNMDIQTPLTIPKNPSKIHLSTDQLKKPLRVPIYLSPPLKKGKRTEFKSTDFSATYRLPVSPRLDKVIIIDDLMSVDILTKESMVIRSRGKSVV